MSDTKTKTESQFFTRNYLTFVIILIVLMVIAISTVLAFAAPSLDVFQKWFLILALIFFAFFSTAAVTWLIMRHSKKLTVSDNDNSLSWETTSAEKQKRKLNNEVRELAKQLDIPTEQLSDLRSAFIVAEDLALRKIQSEATTPLMHKISVGNSDFDAIYIENDLITCIEVTFLVMPDISQEKINLFLRKATAAKSLLAKFRKGSRVRLLLVLVTQLDEKALNELRSKMRSKFKPELTQVSVDIRFLDFQTLQKDYAED